MIAETIGGNDLGQLSIDETIGGGMNRALP
jgi:hypothetical protein